MKEICFLVLCSVNYYISFLNMNSLINSMVEMTDLFGGMFALGAIILLIFFALGIFFLVFWILMLVDCVKRKFKEDSEKIIWVLVIVLTGIIGALIYYFVVKVKDKKK